MSPPRLVASGVVLGVLALARMATAQDAAPGAEVPAAEERRAVETAVASLRAALGKGFEDDVMRACEALGATRSLLAVPALRGLASDPRDAVAMGALRGLRAIGEARGAAGRAGVGDILLALQKGLESRPVVRAEAVSALGALGERRALPVLRDLVADPSTALAAAAIVALGRAPHRDSVEPILKHWEWLLGAAKWDAGEKRRDWDRGPRLSTLQGPMRDALRRLTGKAFEEYEAWRDWWKANRRTFRVPDAPAGAEPPEPEAGEAPAEDAPPPEAPVKPPPASPEEEARRGRERTDLPPFAHALGVPVVARDTPGCVVATLGGTEADAEEAKALAAVAVRVEAALRDAVPAPPGDRGPVGFQPVAVWSLPSGNFVRLLLGAAGLRAGELDAAERALASAGVLVRGGVQPLVLVERRFEELAGEGAHGARLAHGLAHALLGRALRRAGARLPAFLEEGIACAVDRAAVPGADHACTPADRRGAFESRPDWPGALADLVRRGDDPPLESLFVPAFPSDLDGAESAKAGSVVAWLRATRADRWRTLLDALIEGGGAEAMSRVLGSEVRLLDAEWKGWAGR
ncbi:MAG: HEAT repeat domain-containing protein [Planctomycetales bacterium]|nr:HEAT repeat domain-containing protein [Planctomycetales bacterium]